MDTLLELLHEFRILRTRALAGDLDADEIVELADFVEPFRGRAQDLAVALDIAPGSADFLLDIVEVREAMDCCAGEVAP